MKYIKTKKINEGYPRFAPTDPQSGRTKYNSEDGGNQYKYTYTIITKDRLGDRVAKNLDMKDINYIGNHFTAKNDEELEYFRNKYKEGDIYNDEEIAYTMVSPFSGGMGTNEGQINENYSLNDIKSHFDNLSEEDQWKWLIETDMKDKFRIGLDNDNTSIHFYEDEDADMDHTLYFKADIGNRWGVELILKGLGYNAEGV